MMGEVLLGYVQSTPVLAVLSAVFFMALLGGGASSGISPDYGAAA